MTIDLWMLLAAAALQWALIMAIAGPKILSNGMGWAVGNRDDAGPKSAGWRARCERATANMAENLPLFAILVLVAHVSGQADALTGYGAITFVVARLAYSAAYIAGIPGLRTALWGVSVFAGWGLILAGIFT